MSTFEIKMPKLGESITEGTIIAWSVKVGDSVQEDDVLFEVSTKKVSAEIPSPVSGKIIQLLFNEGDTIAVGTVVALVALEGSDFTIPDTSAEEVKPVANIATEQPTPATTEKTPNAESGRWYSPVVLRMAQESQVSHAELEQIGGTGYEGRLSKKDLENYIEQKKKGSKPTATTALSPEVKQPQSTASVSTPIQPAVPTPAQTVTAAGGSDEIKEMDFVRRMIADHMVMSKKTSPHVTTIVEADVTNLVRWRDRVKDEFQHKEGIKLTFMPAIAQATARALAEFPQVNASVDGYKMILKKHINIGIAVSLDNGNLIVPVVKNADQLNINGLAIAIDSLASKARKNKLQPDDIQGGTFTITNYGSFGNIIGTPIINQPEVAILGVGLIEKKPAVIETPDGDMIAIRHKLYLSLSYDHRIIDGSLGGAFVRRIADYLEQWNNEK